MTELKKEQFFTDLAMLLRDLAATCDILASNPDKANLEAYGGEFNVRRLEILGLFDIASLTVFKSHNNKLFHKIAHKQVREYIIYEKPVCQNSGITNMDQS